MASVRNMLQVGNLIKYRKHVSNEYTVGLIVGLTKTTIVLYTRRGLCVVLKNDSCNMQLISRPYSKAL
jgi:hypothetical protein